MDAKLQVASIAVNSLEDATRDFVELLGFDLVGPIEESKQGFDLRWQRVGNESTGFIDLIEPTSDSGMVAKFISRRGEGVYLIQLGVPDLLAAVKELRDRGVQLIGVDNVPPKDLRMFWIHPSSAHGALIEVVPIDEEAAAG